MLARRPWSAAFCLSSRSLNSSSKWIKLYMADSPQPVWWNRLPNLRPLAWIAPTSTRLRRASPIYGLDPQSGYITWWYHLALQTLMYSTCSDDRRCSAWIIDLISMQIRWRICRLVPVLCCSSNSCHDGWSHTGRQQHTSLRIQTGNQTMPRSRLSFLSSSLPTTPPLIQPVGWLVQNEIPGSLNSAIAVQVSPLSHAEWKFFASSCSNPSRDLALTSEQHMLCWKRRAELISFWFRKWSC